MSRFLLDSVCQAEDMVKYSVEILLRKLQYPRRYIKEKSIHRCLVPTLVLHLLDYLQNVGRGSLKLEIQQQKARV